jgi:hypothetical protein
MKCVESTSTLPRNKPRHAGGDDCVEADVRLDAIAHLLHRIFGDRGEVEVLLDALSVGGCGEEGGAALDGEGRKGNDEVGLRLCSGSKRTINEE